MRNLLITSAIAALTAGSAFAGGLDRSGQDMSFMFGNQSATLSYGRVTPSISGTDDTSGSSYDVGVGYSQTTASATFGLTDSLSMGIVMDQPFGADILYNGNPATDALAGTSAAISSKAVTVVGKYQFNERFSAFGGLRFQTAEGVVVLGGRNYSVAIPAGQIANGLKTAGFTSVTTQMVAGLANPATSAASQAALAAAGVPAATIASSGTTLATQAAAGIAGGGYKADISSSSGTGFVLGAAYEIPEIALRAAITYNSSIEHKGSTTETFAGSALAAPGDTTFETPSSINLDFQTGIAEGTLLTFKARLAEWGSFDVVPPALGTDLADIGDSESYRLGIARVINDSWAVSATYSYEPAGDMGVSPLAPTNGLNGLSLGARYQKDNMTISGGINYTKVGDANAEVGGAPVATFTDNSVMGVGLQVSFDF